MALLNRVVWIFSSPGRVFDDIREGRTSWWQPWLIVSIIFAIVGLLALPIQIAVAELNVNNIDLDQLDKQLEMMRNFGWVQALLTPLGLLVFGLIAAGLSYILVTILSSRANFKQWFTLTLYTTIVSSVSQVISVIAVRARGLDSIESVEDSMVTVSLGFLAPEGAGTMLKAFLSSFEFFSIWALVLVVMGLMRIFDMGRGQAIACVVPLWLVSVVLAAVGMLASGIG